MALLPRRLSSCVLPFRHAVRRSLRRCFDAAGAGAEAAALGGRRLTFPRWGAALKRAQGAESSSTSRPYLNLFGIKKNIIYIKADGLAISKRHFGPLFSFVHMYLMQHVKLQPCKWARHTKTDIGMLCSWGMPQRLRKQRHVPCHHLQSSRGEASGPTGY